MRLECQKLAKTTFFVSKLTFLTQILGSVLGGNFMSKVSKMSKLTFGCVKIDIFDMVFGDRFLLVSKVSNLTLLTQNAFFPCYRRLLLFFIFWVHK